MRVESSGARSPHMPRQPINFSAQPCCSRTGNQMLGLCMEAAWPARTCLTECDACYRIRELIRPSIPAFPRAWVTASFCIRAAKLETMCNNPIKARWHAASLVWAHATNQSRPKLATGNKDGAEIWLRWPGLRPILVRLSALFWNCWNPNFVDISKIRF